VAADEEKTPVAQDAAAIIRGKVDALLESDRERVAKAEQAREIFSGMDKVLLPDHAEDELAKLFTLAWSVDRKFVATWARWLEFIGSRWQTDETLRSFDLSRDVCRAAAKMHAKGKARRSSRERKDGGGSRSARERGSRARGDCGTVGRRPDAPQYARRHDRPAQRRAEGAPPRRLAHEAHGGRPCSQRPYALACVSRSRHWGRWRALRISQAPHRLFADRTYQRARVVFLQRSRGEWQIDLPQHHHANFGEYATVASSETFVEVGADRHPTDLALLRGARLVTAQEIDEGRRWALARIKGLTGGDPVTARFVRQDFFTYTPQFKLCISANHRPGLRAVDEAIKRRLHVVPFGVVIPPEERDAELLEALREEWGAILAWALEGCADWQAHGLSQPKAIREATAAYFTDEDVFGHWLDDACELSVDAREPLKNLLQSYRRWAERNGERLLGSKRFSQVLEERGLRRYKSGDVRGFAGVRLKTAFEDDAGNG
jgi:putative DNA primase/helicase